jgi:hypothetical protein
MQVLLSQVSPLEILQGLEIECTDVLEVLLTDVCCNADTDAAGVVGVRSVLRASVTAARVASSCAATSRPYCQYMPAAARPPAPPFGEVSCAMPHTPVFISERSIPSRGWQHQSQNGFRWV